MGVGVGRAPPGGGVCRGTASEGGGREVRLRRARAHRYAGRFKSRGRHRERRERCVRCPPTRRCSAASRCGSTPPLAGSVRSTPLSSRPAGGGRHGSLLAPVPLAPHHRPSRRSEGCPGLLRGAGEPRDAGDDATLTGHRVPGERGQLSGLIRRHLLVRSADA